MHPGDSGGYKYCPYHQFLVPAKGRAKPLDTSYFNCPHHFNKGWARANVQMDAQGGSDEWVD